MVPVIVARSEPFVSGLGGSTGIANPFRLWSGNLDFKVHKGLEMTRISRLFALRFSLGMFGAWALCGAGLAQSLPVFDGAQFDGVVIEEPAATVARNRARIKTNSAKPVIRFTTATPIGQAARGVGQIRVQLEGSDGAFVVACTGFLVSAQFILTSYRCGAGLLEDPDLASRKPTAISRVDFITDYDAPRRGEQAIRAQVEPAPVEMDVDAGYAVLRIAGLSGGVALPLEPETQLRVGAPLTIIGHPLGLSQYVWRDNCAVQRASVPDGVLTQSCDTLPGSEGGPVLDPNGRVVALHLGERAVTLARLVETSKLLRAVSQGADCIGAAAARCGLEAEQPDISPAAAAAMPKRDVLEPDPTLTDPSPRPAPKDAEIAVVPDDETPSPDDGPTAAFPIGFVEGQPAIYGISLPYLPPGTGIELLAGPVGQLDGAEALLTASTAGFAATYTRLNDRHAALSLWRLPTGTLVARRFVTPGAGAMALSPDGRMLALAGQLPVNANATEGPEIALYALPDLDPQDPVDLTGPAPVGALDFSPNGARLAVARAGSAPVVSIWDVERRTSSARIAGLTDPAKALRLGPDGQILAVALPDSVRLYDANTGLHLRDMEPGPQQEQGPQQLSGLAFSPDGSMLIAGAGNAPGLRWDTESGKLRDRIGPAGGGEFLGLNRSGDAVFLSPQGRVEIYGAKQSAPLLRLPDLQVSGAALSHDGAGLIGHVTGHGSGVVFVDPQTLEVRAHRSVEVDAVTALAFSPDSSRLAMGGMIRDSGGGAAQLEIWSWQDGQVTFEAEAIGPKGPNVLAWHPGGSALAVQGDGPLRAHDLINGVSEARFGDKLGTARSLSFLGDGGELIHVAEERIVTLLEPGAHMPRHTWPGHTAAASPDGSQLAVGRSMPTAEIVLVDAVTGQDRRTLEMPFARIGLLAWRGSEPEILGLVQAGARQTDWSLALWSAETGKMIRQFGELSAAPRAMAVSPDGRFVAIAEEGSAEVLLWDMSADRFLWRLDTGGAEVFTLAFAPDGLRIAAGTAPGAVILWDMINGQVKARLAPFATGSLAVVGATVFLSDPTLLDRVAVRLPDGTFLPAAQVLKEGLPTFVPTDLPLEEQVSGLLARLRAGDRDARLLLVDGRALAFDLEFRRELQRQLKTAEVYSGAIDGDIGRGSRRALVLFAERD